MQLHVLSFQFHQLQQPIGDFVLSRALVTNQQQR